MESGGGTAGPCVVEGIDVDDGQGLGKGGGDEGKQEEKGMHGCEVWGGRVCI